MKTFLLKTWTFWYIISPFVLHARKKVIQVHNLKPMHLRTVRDAFEVLFETVSDTFYFFPTDGQCVKNRPVCIHNLQAAWHPHGITLFSVLWVYNLRKVLLSSTPSNVVYLEQDNTQHPNDFAYLYSLWIIQRWNGWPAINLLLLLTLPVVKLSWGWSNLYSKIYFPDMATDIITLGNRMGWPFMILPVSDKYSDKVQIFLKNNFCPPFLSLKPLGMDVCDCSGLFTINVSLEVRTLIMPPMRWTNCMDYWSSWVDPASVC